MKTEVGKLQDLLLARLQDLSKLDSGMVDQESALKLSQSLF